MQKTKIIVGAIIVVALTLTGASCSWFGSNSNNSNNSSNTTTTYPLLSAATNSIDSMFSSNLTQSQTKAKAWKSDAALYAVNIKLPRDLAVNQAVETFVYGSSQDTANWWTYAVSESSGNFVRAIVPKEDYLTSVTKPIDMNYWKINYLEALQIAQNNGGQDFLTNNPSATITETLDNSQPKGWLWWLVEYKGTSGNLSVRINANDKTVVNESGEIISK